MKKKKLLNSFYDEEYLLFLKHYSSELKFMSPWTQIEETDKGKLNENILHANNAKDYNKNIMNSNVMVTK